MKEYGFTAEAIVEASKKLARD